MERFFFFFFFLSCEDRLEIRTVTDFWGFCSFRLCILCECYWIAANSFLQKVALGDRVFSGDEPFPKATCLSQSSAVSWDLGRKHGARPSLAVHLVVLKMMVRIEVSALARQQFAWWNLHLSSEREAEICDSSSDCGWLRYAHEPVALQLEKRNTHFLLNLNNWKWGRIPRSKLWSRTKEPLEWVTTWWARGREWKETQLSIRLPSRWFTSGAWWSLFLGVSALSVCVSVFLSVCVCMSMPVCVCVSICTCLCPSLCISICVCVCRSVSVCTSMPLCVCVCLSICDLSLSPEINRLLQELLSGRVSWAELKPHLVSDQCKNATSRQK